MNKTQELLQLSYENSNSWLISFLGITIGLLIWLSNNAPDSELKGTLAILTILSGFFLFIFYLVQTINYVNLRNYIKSKKE